MQTILIDLDDVMVDLLGAWVSELNRRYDRNVARDEISEWDICKFFPELTRNQVFTPLLEAEFWDSVKPKECAVSFVRKLTDDGYKVRVCTNTDYRIVKEKLDKTLFRYFEYIKPVDVITTAEKQLIAADVLIDDNPDNLIGGYYKGVLFDAPHNKKFDAERHGIKRVTSWHEAYETIIEIVGGNKWKM